MTNALLELARARNWQVGWTTADVLLESMGEIDKRIRDGEIAESVASAMSFTAEHTEADLRGRRVLVVVMPRPAHLVSFSVGATRIEGTLPPTYFQYRPLFEEVRLLLSDALAGATVETLNVPLKLLASRLGLVRYGRTNLTYAPSIGSYLQIFGYLTDAQLPLEAHAVPRDPAQLDDCAECHVCEAVCPTGAIDENRFLLHAERCLTLASETPGDWPDWVPRGSHDCLIGCLTCQRACPANPKLEIADSGVAFDEAETAALVADGEHAGPVWESIRSKLNALGQPYQEGVIGRNVQALLDSHRRRAHQP